MQAVAGWSLILGQLGRGLVGVGMACFIASALAMAFQNRNAKLDSAGVWGFVLGSTCLFGTMACLGALFLTDQFQYEYVASHSWHNVATIYKFASIWAGQQGSFLLWACSASLFGWMALRSTGIYRRWYVFAFSTFLAALCGILAYETPFGLIASMIKGGTVFMPENGIGLNPSLQNYWVVIHPPTIFLGFGSLTVLFVFSMSAMLTGNVDLWIRAVRPWALLSLAILGLGLVMGGLWAYETQGWGGFWAWDPVENVSLVPWLLVVAFVHGIIVQTTRKRWHSTNLVLGAVPFLLFVYGTFLTRSGFLDKFSVHSFAEMNRTALWILLALLVLAVAAFLIVWLASGRRLGKALDLLPVAEGFTLETAYQGGVTLISGLAVAIAIGMSIPFVLGLMGKEAKVAEEPLYHQVVFWFFAPLMVLMAVAPFLTWRRFESRAFWSRFINVLATSILMVGTLLFVLIQSDWRTHADMAMRIDFPFGLSMPRVPWIIGLFFLTALTLTANTWRLVELIKTWKLGVGGFLSHIGLSITMAGLILSRGLEQKEQALVMEGTPGRAMGYSVMFTGMTSNPNTDRDNKATFLVTAAKGNGSGSSFSAHPGFFFNPDQNGDPKPFTWPYIEHAVTHDIYMSMSAPVTDFWEEPKRFSVGETQDAGGVSVTYIAFTKHGEPGMANTSFGAKLKVVEDGQAYFVEPKISVGDGPDSPVASPSLRATLMGIDPADHSIMLQMPYVNTLYPIEMYYKPMTILVWIGTGIMTLGGLMSAFYRRQRTA